MKKFLWFVTILFAMLPASPAAAAVQSTLPPLVFREVKLKGEDFIVLQATADGVDLEDYWLGYDSSATLETINPEYQLAAATLQAGQAVLLANDEAVPTCDAAYAMDMPIDLAETKGTVALWNRDATATTADIHYTRVDSFSWTTKTGKADIIRPTTTEDGMKMPTWFRQLDTGTMNWQLGDLSLNEDRVCTLQTKAGETTTYPTVTDTEPPAVIEAEDADSDSDEETTGPNVGLLAPQITELLPNPSGTGTDATDEYIELYNPNATAFDLSGCTLQTGLTTTHSYVFPAGSAIAGNSFAAYYATETGLAMSNSGGQAVLLAPDGIKLSATDPYGTASDGKTWALADGSWYWTTSPTPAVANVISSQTALKLVTTTKKAVKAATTKKATTKKTTAKTAAKKTTKAKAATTASTASAAPERTTRGIHPLVLALVTLAAVGYGLYEYRHDLANAVHQYRTNRAARRSHRR